MSRTLPAHASLPPSFWHHALQMATYLLNVLPSKLLGNKSPLEVLYTRVPSYDHIRVFGCLCYPLIPSTTINKLQPRSTPCVFLGYPTHHRGYKCYDLSSHKIIICRHVLFDEHTFPFASLHSPKSHTYDFLDEGLSPYVIHHLHQLTPTPSSQPNVPSEPNSSPPDPISSQITPAQTQIDPSPTNSPIQQPRVVTRSKHGIYKPNKKYSMHTTVERSPLPRNPIAALRDPNWKMVMDDEYDALCGFSLIKSNLMVFLRGIKPIL